MITPWTNRHPPRESGGKSEQGHSRPSRSTQRGIRGSHEGESSYSPDLLVNVAGEDLSRRECESTRLAVGRHLLCDDASLTALAHHFEAIISRYGVLDLVLDMTKGDDELPRILVEQLVLGGSRDDALSARQR